VGTPLIQLQRQHLLNPKAFREQQKAPVLLWKGDEVPRPDNWEPTQAGGISARPAARQVLVLPVEKHTSKVNAFGIGITLGRVPTNDIVLDDPSISRFHAFFQFDERKGVWTVSDADSQNGSRLAGNVITGRQPIADGSHLIFGVVATRFMLPDTFCMWLVAGADSSTL
jgi:hypothetical protein